MARNEDRGDRAGKDEQGRGQRQETASEWGQGAAGGYGRSGDYGHKGGAGREGGADAGEGTRDDAASDPDRSDADRSDAGDEGPGRGAD